MVFTHKISWKKIEEKKIVNSEDPFKRESIELLFERKAQYTTLVFEKRSKNYNAMVSRQM